MFTEGLLPLTVLTCKRIGPPQKEDGFSPGEAAAAAAAGIKFPSIIRYLLP